MEFRLEFGLSPDSVLESGLSGWTPHLGVRRLDLDVGFLTLSLEFGLGVSVLNLECTVRTLSLDSGLGALSLHLGVCSMH